MEGVSGGYSGFSELRLIQEIQRLRIREQRVKAHEMAHKVAAGELGGAPKYKYNKGPDGKMYIVGGEVPIRLKEGKTPEETIEIARRVRKAALAPVDPSPQDRAVAARATAMEMRARLELQREIKGEARESGRGLSVYA
jgi:hypothetical protein